MTQSIESMIEILQAYKDGKKVGFIDVDNDFVELSSPAWDFSSTKYVVAPEPKKKVKILAWFDTCTLRLSYLGEGSAVSGDWIRVPSEDKEILL